MQSFKDVPVGTKCFVKHRNGWYVTYITRVTKTQVVTKMKPDSQEQRFKVNTGYQIGTDKYTHNTLEVFTEVHQAIIDKYLLNKAVKEVLESLMANSKSLTKEDLLLLNSIKVGE